MVLPGGYGASERAFGIPCCLNYLPCEQGVGGAALCTCVTTSHQHSPLPGWCRPAMFAQLHFASSVPSLGGAALCVLIPHFCVPALLLLLYVIRAGSGWGLYVCARRSAFSLSWAALHMHTTTLASSAPSPCRTALRVHSSTPLSPQGAALQWIPQSSASPALSSGGAASRARVTVSHYLCSSWREQSSMRVPQHFASSTLS